MNRRTWGSIAAAAVLILAVTMFVRSQSGYEVQFLMPSAAQLAKGSPVWIAGANAGSISDIKMKDGEAVVTAKINGSYAPLHAGTQTRVDWQSVVGERILTVVPGPE